MRAMLRRSLTDSLLIYGWLLAWLLSIGWVTAEEGLRYEDVIRVLSLRDYNTRLVVLSTSLLGVSCGLVGGFLLLRKRSLMGDTLSHAMLPGIGFVFLVLVGFGGNGKSLPWLLAGAGVAGTVGFLCVLGIRSYSRIKDDAAMGIVLSVFFGLGVVLLGLIQNLPQGSAAGLESFIYGKAASMIAQDLKIITLISAIALILCCVFYKEFRLICFDEGFAKSQGWPTGILDMLLLGLVTLVTVAGLQAVGLILVIAFLITPAAAARFWTDKLWVMLLGAAGIGGLSGWIGAALSGLYPRLPAGALIVLTAALLFLISMLFGPSKGVVIRRFRQVRLRRKIGLQHLLRACYEHLEGRQSESGGLVTNHPVPLASLLPMRSWSRKQLAAEVAYAYRTAQVEKSTEETVWLSEAGFKDAAKVTRNHRLWELFLIENADIAPSHVDRDADAVEHVLGEDLVRELESHLEADHIMPGNPHQSEGGNA